MGPVEMMANMPAGPDMGITDLLATLGGYQIENPDKRKKTEIKPGRKQEKFSGKKKWSCNLGKSGTVVATVQELKILWNNVANCKYFYEFVLLLSS